MEWDDEFGYGNPEENEVLIPENRCGNCRYSSSILSDKKGQLWCVEHSTHKSDLDPGCEAWLRIKKR